MLDIVQIFVLLVIVILLIVDVRAMILMYRSRDASEHQKKRLMEQMKELTSL